MTTLCKHNSMKMERY